MFHPESVHLACELIAELLEEILPKQLLLKRTQDPRLDFIAADGQVVVAPTLVACPEAGEPVAPGHDDSGTADAALRQAREQVMRSLRSADRSRCLHRM